MNLDYTGTNRQKLAQSDRTSMKCFVLIHITTNSDSYVRVVLSQIEDLVAALGLTKEDYLQYIQQAYGVERRQLWPTEIFEVVIH